MQYGANEMMLLGSWSVMPFPKTTFLLVFFFSSIWNEKLSWLLAELCLSRYDKSVILNHLIFDSSKQGGIATVGQCSYS